MTLEQQLQLLLGKFSEFSKVYVAYSGGLDSHVLLQVAAKLPELTAKLEAIYINHGLQAIAEEWEQHCATIAQALGVAFQALRVEAFPKSGESPEEAARNARYKAFSTLMDEHSILLLAQHRDDQLETVLLQLFRGAGLSGLAGMPETAAFGRGMIARPFLHVARSTLEKYAREYRLNWVEDPTNSEHRFDRNFLRHAILPLIKQRWPSAASTVARSARHCAAAADELALDTGTRYAAIVTNDKTKLDLSELARCSAYRQRLLVRQWCVDLGLKMPSEAWLENIFKQVIGAEHTRNPELFYQRGYFKRHRKFLYFLRPAAEHPKFLTSIIWPEQAQTLHLEGYGTLGVSPNSVGIKSHYWRSAKVDVRFRQGGEKMALPGRAGSHELKKLFQEAGVPAWERAQMPLIYIDNQLAAVADRWISRDFWAEGDALKIHWQREADVFKVDNISS